MNQNNNGFAVALFGLLLVCTVIGSCNNQNSTTVTSSPAKNDYQDMRSRGHSEEDAVIFSILKQQGHSDYDAIQATKGSK